MRRGYRCVNTNVLLFLRLPPALLVRPAARDSPRARKQSTTKTDRIKLQSGSREAEPSPAVKCVKMSPSCLNSGKEATRVPALTLPLQKYRPKSVLAARNFNISPNKNYIKLRSRIVDSSEAHGITVQTLVGKTRRRDPRAKCSSQWIACCAEVTSVQS